MRPTAAAVLSGSNINGILPAFSMRHRVDMWNINPKKGIMSMQQGDNKQHHQPITTTKAAKNKFSESILAGLDIFYHYHKERSAENRKFLDFTSGALPPVDLYFIAPDPVSASKTLAEELAASTTFAEAAYLYPSATAALGNFQSFAHNKQQPAAATTTATMDYISLSNNIPPTMDNIDIGEVEKLISQGKVAVVFVDPINNNVTPQYLQSLRTACDKSGVLLAFDEVQCGIGQTGRLWAHKALGVEPDFMIVQFRGPIGIGALLVNEKMNAHMIHKYENLGDLQCFEALNVFRKVAQVHHYMDHTTKLGRYLEDILSKQLGRKGHVRGTRALGLVVEVELDDAQSFVDKCNKRGLGIETVGNGNIIRIMPPFTVRLDELDDAVSIMEECLDVLGLGQ